MRLKIPVVCLMRLQIFSPILRNNSIFSDMTQNSDQITLTSPPHLTENKIEGYMVSSESHRPSMVQANLEQMSLDSLSTVLPLCYDTELM